MVQGYLGAPRSTLFCKPPSMEPGSPIHTPISEYVLVSKPCHWNIYRGNNMRIGHGHLLNKILDKCQEALSSVVDMVKTAITTCAQSVKGVLTAALAVAQAAAKGDMKGLVTACMTLATSVGEMASAPFGMVEEAAMGMVKKVMLTVAKALPIDAKIIAKITAGIDAATTFADMANPAAMLTEGAKLAAGMPSSFTTIAGDIKSLHEV